MISGPNLSSDICRRPNPSLHSAAIPSDRDHPGFRPGEGGKRNLQRFQLVQTAEARGLHTPTASTVRGV